MLVKPSVNIHDLLTFILTLNEVSVRAFDPQNEERPTPHYPVVKIADLKNTLYSLFDEGFYAIVAKPIDPQFAELAGCIWKNEDMMRHKSFIIELATGPCTVRKVTHEGIVDYREYYPANTSIDHRVLDMIKVIRDVPYKNCVFEMSYYSTKVGYQSDNVIVWDITGEDVPKSIDL
jgi:hypothetical protein